MISIIFYSDTLAFPMQDNCSTKLLTLLRSINLEKYWSTFERNEVLNLFVLYNAKEMRKPFFST